MTDANEHALLNTHLKTLRLPTFAHNHRPFAEDAARNNLGYDRYLLGLAEQEVAQRDRNQQARAIRAARFPLVKQLADFDFSAVNLNKARVLDLARGEYITHAENLILLGNPGLGKSHVALALGQAACAQKRRVRFYSAAGLVNDLLTAQDKLALPRLIQQAQKHELLIIDELGFVPLTESGAQLLFQFCSALHERVSLIVTTNLPFAKWTQVFRDETMTAALVDRLTHRGHVIEFVGESFRFKQRMKKAKTAAT